MFSKSRKVILIFGKTGTGKSYLAKQLLDNFSRSVVVDLTHEYHNGVIFYTIDDVLDFFENPPEAFRIICRFEHLEDYDYLFRAVWVIGNMCVLIEESWNFSSEGITDSPFTKLVNMGRHKDISLICLSQRPYGMNINLRAQFHTIIAFHTTEQRDLDILQGYGFNPSYLAQLDQQKYQYALVGKTL